MRIVVFGAAGRAGSCLITEAAARGHEVTAVVRDAAKLPDPPVGVEVVQADVTDPALVKGLAGQADALVLAVGSTDPRMIGSAVDNVVEAVRGVSGDARPRVLQIGGGGSLLDAGGVRFVDHPDFPEQIRAGSLAQAATLETWRGIDDVAWTYVSPPPVNLVEGPRRGNYRTGTDRPVIAPDGTSTISYADLAVAVIDELERGRHVRQRFTVGY